MYEYLLLSYHVPLAACLVSHAPSYSRRRSTRPGSASLIAVELEFDGQHTDSLFVFLYIILSNTLDSLIRQQLKAPTPIYNNTGLGRQQINLMIQ